MSERDSTAFFCICGTMVARMVLSDICLLVVKFTPHLVLSQRSFPTMVAFPYSTNPDYSSH